MRLVLRHGTYDRNFTLVKAKVKGHYRTLPDGRRIWIAEHKDKRKDAKKDPKKYRGKVIHTDDKSTTYMTHQDETRTISHRPELEMSEGQIKAHINRAMSVDDDLAWKVFLTQQGIEDIKGFLDGLIEDEKEKADATGKDPEFTNREGAIKWLKKNQIKPILKELQKEYGEVTTPAKAVAGGGTLAGHFNQVKDHPELSEDYKALARMAVDYGEEAHAEIEEELKAVEEADKMGPKDAPMTPSLSPKIKYFGHQAEALAKLSVLPKAIIDVDMGGGKGLILPADAMNLMAQGKVKKPMIVVPGMTLEQNAKKIIEYTDGKMNVFMIDNNIVRDEYDGDLEALREDIDNAPPNTIFMVDYGVFSYRDRKKEADEGGEERFERAEMLGAAGFDYVALDESHNIKNMTSKRFKAMQSITHIPIKRVASGTFLSNNPRDVLGQLTFLHPHLAMSEKEFDKKYGRTETSSGIKWDENKLKELRGDLKNLGMISLRRSAWMHLLPERQEMLAVSKMEGKHAQIHEAVVNETMDHLEELMANDPKLKRFLEEDEDFDEEEMPPNVLGPLNLLQALTDHPDELATNLELMMEELKAGRKGSKVYNILQKKQAITDKGRQTKADKAELAKLDKALAGIRQSEIDAAQLRLDKESGNWGNEQEKSWAELQALKRSVNALSPGTRASIVALKGQVSPKAKDCYKKMEEHFKDPKNGKFMVFCQRKLSAAHIINNMPEHLKKHAVYFDASKKEILPSFTEDPNGPKILVAVDASIKEGMNMQIANAQYRYDHHYSPGNQEQGYARIWRFGQDKPAKIHLGIVDNGVDVTKYARLISKLHTNQMVVSEMDDDETFNAYKLSLDNIRNNRSAEILPEYTDMNKKILDFQMDENKDLQKKYGNKPYDRAAPEKQIGGKKAEMMHGMGPYTSDIDLDNTPPPKKKEVDAMLGHLRAAHHKFKMGHMVYNSEWQDEAFPEMIKLYYRQKARNPNAKELEDHTLKQYEAELEEPLSNDARKLFKQVVGDTLKGKKPPAHKKFADPMGAMDEMMYHAGVDDADRDPELDQIVLDDVKKIQAYAKKKKAEFVHLGQGKIENPEDFKKFFDELEKKEGKVSNRHKKLVMGIAAMLDEIEGGYDKIAEAYSWNFNFDIGDE